MAVNEFHTLYKHSSGTTAWVINCTAVWFYHLCNQFYNTCRSIEFSVFFCTGRSIYLEEILIYTTNEVLFLKSFLINLVYVINEVLNFCFIGTKRGKQVQCQCSLKWRITFLYICHCLVDDNSNIICRCIFYNVRPASSFLKIENIRCIVK